MARIDDEGYVFIVDRMKDMIVRGGENIYSIEVESVLNSHPQVLESAVVPEAHPIFGEVVRACVVLRPETQTSVEEILEYCRQHLADFKVPARVLFLPELPRNPGGKVIKKELRERPSKTLPGPMDKYIIDKGGESGLVHHSLQQDQRYSFSPLPGH